MSEKKVLIVDYDKKSIAALESLLSPYNLQVIRATDGLSAFEKFLKEKPALILLEPMLPKLHGFDLARKIRGEEGAKVPIIIITGLYKGSQYKNEAVSSFQVAGYFEKPYNGEALLKMVLSLVHDEVPVEEDLPDPESVLQKLASMAGELPDRLEEE
jgi:DNA-binding response OmpR family regulator